MDIEVSGVNMMKDEEPDEVEAAEVVEETTETELEAEASETVAETSAEEAEVEASVEDDDVGDETEAAPEEELVSNITPLPQSGMQHLRMLEAMLFATTRPVSEKELAARMPQGVDIGVLVLELAEVYEKRGVVLEKIADKWTFRTAADLNYLFQKEAIEPKRLSKAGIETLAIIAYHQPVTRAEIEDIRGVTVSKGTVDLLLDVGWIRLRGRRRTPGRPITYGTTEDFLEHFGLEGVSDLPGLEDLKAAGLLDANLPPSFSVPGPNDQIGEDEDPLEDEDEPDLLDGLEDDFEDQEEVEASDETAETTAEDEDASDASDEEDLENDELEVKSAAEEQEEIEEEQGAETDEEIID